MGHRTVDETINMVSYIPVYGKAGKIFFAVRIFLPDLVRLPAAAFTPPGGMFL